MNKIHWKPFVEVDNYGYPFWGTRIVLPTLIGLAVGLVLGAWIMAVGL